MKIDNRAVLSHPVLTGISREHLGALIEELADPWTARQESVLWERRGRRDRLRAEGGGPDHRLPFVDRVIATLVILRFQLPHAALAVFYKVDRSTITRAVQRNDGRNRNADEEYHADVEHRAKCHASSEADPLCIKRSATVGFMIVKSHLMLDTCGPPDA